MEASTSSYYDDSSPTTDINSSIIAKDLYNAMCKGTNNILDLPQVRAIFAVLYFVVFVTAVTGNSLVVYVVMNKKRMQTVTNVFIANLAVSDLLVNFTSLWLTPTYTIVGHWVWGGALCHGLPLFQGTSIFISTLTLTSIAVDRYFVIVHHSTSSVNINDHMSMKMCILLITLIWLVSLLLVMPYAIHMQMSFIGEPCNFHICIEKWTMQRLKSIYGTTVLCLQVFTSSLHMTLRVTGGCNAISLFVVPFIIIGISYRLIWNFLNARRRANERAVETKRKKRLLTMLVIMVVIFAVCWFPCNLLNILRDLGQQGLFQPHFRAYFMAAHLISMTATCWNPILYAWMNESFREEFVQALPCLRSRISAQTRVRVVTDCKPASARTNCAESMDSEKLLNGERRKSTGAAVKFTNRLMKNGKRASLNQPETTMFVLSNHENEETSSPSPPPLKQLEVHDSDADSNNSCHV